MKNPRKFLVIVFLLAGLASSAQKTVLEQGLGFAATQSDITGYARATTDSSFREANYTVRLRQFGLVYLLRVNLVQSKNFSISLGSPMMLGWSASGNYHSVDFDGTKRDTVEGIKGTQLAMDLPAMLDLNFGLHSARDESRRALGLYVGAGYSYGFTKISTSVGTAFYDGFEPVIHAGIRMGKAWENRWSINVSVRGGFNDHANRAYGLQILKEL